MRLSVSSSVYTTFKFSVETVNKVTMLFCNLDSCFRSKYMITKLILKQTIGKPAKKIHLRSLEKTDP